MEDTNKISGPTRKNYRVPGELMPTYLQIISKPEGQLVMKRIKVDCGVCRATRYYSIHRGITRIAGIVACEACRQFYQRYKKTPWAVTCYKGGSCFTGSEISNTKCKGCWVVHVLRTCPIPLSLYKRLSQALSHTLKAKLPESGHPPAWSDIKEDQRGGLGLELLQDGVWIDVSEEDVDLDKILKHCDENDVEERIEDIDVTEYEEEEVNVDDPESVTPSDAKTEEVVNPSIVIAPRTSKRVKLVSKKLPKDTYADPDDLVLGDSNLDSYLDGQSTLNAERLCRQKKKVQYFNSGSVGGRGKSQLPVHDLNGVIIATGVDLCDCLIFECPGCHFPCPKCKSPKCGPECRMNRKWYFESIEVEGTRKKWQNLFIKK